MLRVNSEVEQGEIGGAIVRLNLIFVETVNVLQGGDIAKFENRAGAKGEHSTYHTCTIELQYSSQ